MSPLSALQPRARGALSPERSSGGTTEFPSPRAWGAIQASQRQIARTLGVGHKTVNRDVSVSNDTEPHSETHENNDLRDESETNDTEPHAGSSGAVGGGLAHAGVGQDFVLRSSHRWDVREIRPLSALQPRAYLAHAPERTRPDPPRHCLHIRVVCLPRNHAGYSADLCFRHDSAMSIAPYVSSGATLLRRRFVSNRLLQSPAIGDICSDKNY